MNFFINFLIVLVIVALVILVLYLFEKYVAPIDRRIRGIVIFVVAVLLVVYILTGHKFI